MKPATASQLAERFGMTSRYWTRMAAEGKVPGAWRPSDGRGKWLFDLHAVETWQKSRLVRVEEWQKSTSAGRRTGAAPSVTIANTDSASAQMIDALLKTVYANG